MKKTVHIKRIEKLEVPGSFPAPPIETEPMLVELVCAGCMVSRYVPVIFIGGLEDLDNLPEKLGWTKTSMRHLDGVYESEKMRAAGTPSGYAFCGMFHVVRLWRHWRG